MKNLLIFTVSYILFIFVEEFDFKKHYIRYRFKKINKKYAHIDDILSNMDKLDEKLDVVLKFKN